MKLKLKVSKTADDVEAEKETSAKVIASIDDLLEEIFLRLPIKSLIRFKLVSKHWNSLISDPRFCILRNPDPNPAVGLFFEHYNDNCHCRYEYIPFYVNKSFDPPFRKLNFSKDHRKTTILHSCNGLLLCCALPPYSPKYYRTYYVYNPTISKFSTLPKPNIGLRNSLFVVGMSLAFDPTKSPHYKVICVLELRRNKYQLEVFSSETRGPWRKCGEPFKADADFENGVYWNGSIHWIDFFQTGESLYFNPHNHQMPMVMPMPHIPDVSNCRLVQYFGESCDHLHYVKTRLWIQFDVYEMKMDYSEWFVKYKVDLSNVVRDNYFSICTLIRGKKEDDSFLILLVKDKVIIRYNLIYMTWETIYELEGGYCPSSTDPRFPLHYIESLCGV